MARLDTAPLEEALNEAEEVVIDDRERIEAQVTAAEENLHQAEDTLSDLQLNYPSEERARLELRQDQDALSKARQANNKAKSAYESARKTRDNRKADLNAANKAVNKTQSAYDQVAANLASSLAAQASAQQNLTAAQANQAAAQAAYDQVV